MTERSGGNPNEGDFVVTDEGDVVPAEAEPQIRSLSADEREDVGHDALVRSSDTKSDRTTDKSENPYWPNVEQREAAERAATERAAMERKAPDEPWREKIPKSDDEV